MQVWGNYYRYLVASVAFLCLISIYANQNCINITLICMANDTSITRASDNKSIYKYSTDEEKLIQWALGSGTVVGTFPINYLYVKYGAKMPFLFSGIVSSISTALIPIAVGYDFKALLVTRFFQGLAYAADFGVIGIIVTRWAPFDETTFFLAFLTSFSPFATSISNKLSTLICQNSFFGWKWVFYFHAIFTVIIFSFWILIYYDDPSKSDRLSKKEFQRIQKNKSAAALDFKVKVPYGKLLRSPVVLTIWLNAFFEITTIILLSIHMPKYYHYVLGFTLSETADNILLFLVVANSIRTLYAIVNDKIRFIPEYWKIKISNLLAVGFCGIAFALIGFVPSENRRIAFLLCFLTCAFTVFNCSGFYKCAALHSRQFAHVVISTCQFMKCVALFVAPALVAFFVTNESDRLEWIPVFLILGISSVVVSIFSLFILTDKPAKWTDV